MDKMCAILQLMAEWLNRTPDPPLIYATMHRGRSFNHPTPLIGLLYQAIGEHEWWRQGPERYHFPHNHLRINWCHQGSCSAEPTRDVGVWACAFSVKGIREFDEFIAGPRIESIPVKDPLRLNHAFQSVSTHYLMRRKTSSLRLKAALLNLMATALDEAYGLQNVTDAPLPQPVDQALKFMHRNLHRTGITLPDIVRASGLSLHHFGRVFLKTMHQPPMKYLQSIRIEHSRNLLRETNLRVSEIAVAVGFSDPLHFSRLFRAMEGRSPAAFRENSVQHPPRLND